MIVNQIIKFFKYFTFNLLVKTNIFILSINRLLLINFHYIFFIIFNNFSTFFKLFVSALNNLLRILIVIFLKCFYNLCWFVISLERLRYIQSKNWDFRGNSCVIISCILSKMVSYTWCYLCA